MDSDLKAKWMKALRSGRYKQGRNFIKRGDTYCCLGVLCKIQRVEFTKKNFPDGLKGIAPDEFSGGLPEDKQRVLACMNDGKDGFARQSFKQIADYIETNL